MYIHIFDVCFSTGRLGMDCMSWGTRKRPVGKGITSTNHHFWRVHVSFQGCTLPETNSKFAPEIIACWKTGVGDRNFLPLFFEGISAKVKNDKHPKEKMCMCC